MGALPTSEPVAFRFAPYIKELREFFAVSHLHFGAPEDIFPVNERLQTSKAFAEDMSSMIRAILLREGGSMAHAQLLEILAIAIGGPAMDHASQDYRQPLRQLLAFLTGVLRRPWNLPPGEEPEPDAPSSVAEYSAETGSFDSSAVVAFPSGPIATAAALAAAEQRAAESTQRQPEPAAEAPAIRSAPETAVPAPVEPQLAAASVAPPPDASSSEPEYAETEEYDTLDLVPPEPTGIAAAEAQAETSPAQTEPAVEAAPPQPEAVASEPIPPQNVPQPAKTAFRSNSELIDQVFQPPPQPAETPTAEASLAPTPHSAAPRDPAPENRQSASTAAHAVPPDVVASPTEPTKSPPVLSPTEIVAAAAKATGPQPVAHAATATPIVTGPWARQHYELSSEHWHDSPFHDSPFDDLDSPELVPDPPARHRAGGAAPWVSNAADSVPRVPRISPSVRNVLIMGAAAVAIAVFVAVALRPPNASQEDLSHLPATRSTADPAAAPSSSENPTATPLTPQPRDPAATSAQSPGSAPVTAQSVSARRSRPSSDEDEDYNGSDVAPATYRSFVAPPAANSPSGQPAASPQQNRPAGEADPPGSYSNQQQSGSAERRGATPEIGSGLSHQSFRNPDATMVGDSRPVRPSPRSLNGEPTFKVSSGLMAANLISAPNPEYPALARLTHTQGEVILQAVISRDGHVSAAHVLSGHRLLRGAAIDAVKRWRYRPYIADGHPVDVATIIRVDFRTHN